MIIWKWKGRKKFRGCRYGSGAGSGLKVTIRRSLPVLPLVLFLFAGGPQKLYPESEFFFRLHSGYQIPDQREYFSNGLDLNAALDWRMLSFFGASLQGGYSLVPTLGSGNISILDAGLGPFFVWRPASRFSLSGEISGGLYSASWNDQSVSGITVGARVSANWHLTPSVALVGYGSAKQYAYFPSALMNTVTAGVGISINLSEVVRKETRVRMEKLSQGMVFPVSYAWYNDNPFATVRITNSEPNDITMVNTSFYMEQYMSQPKLCGTKDVLRPGESVEVPITAFFNETMMSLTENVVAGSRIIVEYRSLGTVKRAQIPIEIPVYHRNAMSWDDDRRAAAFVSARDPAALWFSRYVSSVVQNRLRPGINRNIQYALGLFETLNIYGINYVVDPSSSYVELSESTTSLDSLNYPHQTLMYRGGDCDDLSILFSSLLEAAGIETAFITIPGHIYMAFDSGMTEEEARRDFYAAEYLVFHEGRAWVPLEITIPREGFYRAWRIGHKEWSDNARRGTAAIFPMHDSWKFYPPVSVPGAASRFTLPADTETALAFDRSMNEYIEGEIRPRILAYQAQLARGEDPRVRNEMGVLYGRYGILDKAAEQFDRAARQGSVDGLVNLGNVAFLEQRWQDALSYYEQARRIQPDNSLAFLGSARCYYEINDFGASDNYYAGVRRLDPDLAGSYAYLSSFFESRGRGFSLADRLGNAPWSLPEMRLAPAEVPAAVVPDEPEDTAEAAPQGGLTAMISIGDSLLESAFIGPDAPAQEEPALPAESLPDLMPIQPTATAGRRKPDEPDSAGDGDSPGPPAGSDPVAGTGAIAAGPPAVAPSRLAGSDPVAGTGAIAAAPSAAAPGLPAGSDPVAAPGAIAAAPPAAAPGPPAGSDPVAVPGAIAAAPPAAMPGLPAGSDSSAVPGAIAAGPPVVAPGRPAGSDPVTVPGAIAAVPPAAAPSLPMGSDPGAVPGAMAAVPPAVVPGLPAGSDPGVAPGATAAVPPAVAPGRPAGSDPGAETTPQEQTAETSPAEAVLPSADYIDKLENEESKSPLFWVLGGIAAALGGVVLFLTRKMKKKPGFKQENKEG